MLLSLFSFSYACGDVQQYFIFSYGVQIVFRYELLFLSLFSYYKFSLSYLAIFLIGVSGNMLVVVSVVTRFFYLHYESRPLISQQHPDQLFFLCVCVFEMVFRKHMQTTTNMYILNMAAADILMCLGSLSDDCNEKRLKTVV